VENKNADALSRIYKLIDNSLMTFEEFMKSKKIFINNNVKEVNEKFNNIPTDFNEILFIPKDLIFKLHLMREYINSLGHIRMLSEERLKVEEIKIINDNRKKYIDSYIFMSF